jgi:hypothetical protein
MRKSLERGEGIIQKHSCVGTHTHAHTHTHTHTLLVVMRKQRPCACEADTLPVGPIFRHCFMKQDLIEFRLAYIHYTAIQV